ncbi:MAG: flagellar hook assembly protein FlgD [Synergistaceae bacterium]|nr:flagellar hook assembly protein FlgD [Synergistaceae bacterium]
MPVTDVTNYTNPADIAQLQTTTSTQSASAVTNATNDTLGKDAFLKLLIAELSNQDPLNPMEDREFISQMATFSSLEQMQNMNKTLEGMADSTRFSAVQYIGKAVAFTKGEGTEAQQVAAIVNHVWFDPNGQIVLDTTEGEVNLEDVQGVSEIG